MDIFSITNLPVDTLTGLYDFTVSTFTYKLNFNLFAHVVKKDEEMRIDLIANRIYENTLNIDMLLELNNIVMPLNIHEGDVLFYVRDIDVQNFRVQPNILNQLKTQLINTNKKVRIDKNRKKRIEEDTLSLPPTINQRETEPVKISGDNIILGGGLF